METKRRFEKITGHQKFGFFLLVNFEQWRQQRKGTNRIATFSCEKHIEFFETQLVIDLPFRDANGYSNSKEAVKKRKQRDDETDAETEIRNSKNAKSMDAARKALSPDSKRKLLDKTAEQMRKSRAKGSDAEKNAKKVANAERMRVYRAAKKAAELAKMNSSENVSTPSENSASIPSTSKVKVDLGGLPSRKDKKLPVDDEISEYEKIRLQNIHERNQKYQKQFGSIDPFAAKVNKMKRITKTVANDGPSKTNAVDVLCQKLISQMTPASKELPVLVLRPSAKLPKKINYFSDDDDFDLYSPEPQTSINGIMRPFRNASAEEKFKMDYSSRHFVEKILETIPVDEKSYDFALLLDYSGTFNQVVSQFHKNQHPDENFPELLLCIRQVMYFGYSHKEKRYLKPYRIQEIVIQALQFQEEAWKLRGLKPYEKNENDTILNTILETMKNSLICFNKNSITKLATGYFDYWRRNKELPNDMLKKAELQKDLLEATQLYFKSLRKTSAYNDIPLLF